MWPLSRHGHFLWPVHFWTPTRIYEYSLRGMKKHSRSLLTYMWRIYPEILFVFKKVCAAVWTLKRLYSQCITRTSIALQPWTDRSGLVCSCSLDFCFCPLKLKKQQLLYLMDRIVFHLNCEIIFNAILQENWISIMIRQFGVTYFLPIKYFQIKLINGLRHRCTLPFKTE